MYRVVTLMVAEMSATRTTKRQSNEYTRRQVSPFVEMIYLDVVVVVEELGESQRQHDSAISLIILSCAEIT